MTQEGTATRDRVRRPAGTAHARRLTKEPIRTVHHQDGPAARDASATG